MFDFSCHTCGKPYSVPDGRAGRDVQCEYCGVLLSVPRAADAGNINPDGTFKVGPAVVLPAGSFAARWWNFARADDGRWAGDVPRPAGGRPRSPPIDPHPAVLPSGVWLALFRPLNLAVMAFVVLAHVLASVAGLALNFVLLFAYFIPLALIALILGHYGNVVDEVARADRDELPRPIRSLDWRDDIWLPFCDVAIFCTLLAAPAAVGLYLSARYPETFGLNGGTFPTGELVVVLSALALVFAPALLLTLRTSGSLRNLRPDRIWGTVAACGTDYYAVASIGLVALPVMAAGLAVSSYWWLGAIDHHPFGDWGAFDSFWASHGLLAAGVYLCHAFAWRVGLLYRLHHAALPWVDQRSPLGDGPDVRLSPEQRTALLAAKQSALRSAKDELMQDLRRAHGM